MRYCQRIYIKYFSNFKRTHRIDFFFVKFWKFIMLQLFIHFDMTGDGRGRWCYLPNLFKQVHNFFYSIYWRDCYYLLATDHLVKHSDTETSFFGEGGRLNEVTSFVLDCLDSICGIVLLFAAIISMNFRNWHHFGWG